MRLPETPLHTLVSRGREGDAAESSLRKGRNRQMRFWRVL